MKYTCLIAVFLVLALPVIAKKESANHDKKFRHELAIGLRALRIPVGDWRDLTIPGISPEYSLRYSDKYGLKIRLLGWMGKRLEWSYEKRPFYIGQIVERRYVYWDILPFYTFNVGRRHFLSVGAGYATRKGKELFVDAIYTFDMIFGGYDVNDKGMVGELSYTYDISEHFVAGADIAYRTYDRGDPVISAGVKFGIVLRH